LENNDYSFDDDLEDEFDNELDNKINSSIDDLEKKNIDNKSIK
jgi:hypothetical protein